MTIDFFEVNSLFKYVRIYAQNDLIHNILLVVKMEKRDKGTIICFLSSTTISMVHLENYVHM